MRFSGYVLLLFSISLVFYLMGFKSVLLVTLFDNQGGDAFEPQGFLGKVAEGTLAPQNAIALLGIGVVATLAVSLVAGYAAIYIIPMAILIMILNFVVYPFSFIIDPATPDIIKFPLVVFFNILSILALLSFIRGGDV